MGENMKEKEVVLKLYQNVEMGIVGIDSIDKYIKENSLKKVIYGQKSEYETLKNKLLDFCKDYNVKDKELSPFAKISSDMMVKMQMLRDSNDSHIAKMMMEGTNKGLIELEKLNNDYHGTDDSLREMIHKIIIREQQNNEELKVFL